MNTKAVGWLVSLGLGVALFGASGADDASGVARANQDPAAGAEMVFAASASDRATSAVSAPVVSVAAPAARKAPAKLAATSQASQEREGNDDVVQANTSVKVSATPAGAVELLGGACPKGMAEVEGDYCPHVEETCLRWLDPDEKMRCAEFAPGTRCEGKPVHKHYCIDAFEYPNEPGARPVVMKSWYEARDACSSAGKRLCGDSEWTLACEGQERMPYPYGYTRNADACNIDKPHPDVDEAAIANPATRQAEVERLWQGEPSGSREACVSAYGVHDMTGNVDEWVVNESAKPYRSGLKGGYWGPVRDRCRPMTTAHNEDFSFYQIGFRCCSDPQAPNAPTTAPANPSANPGVPGSHGGPAANSLVPSAGDAPLGPVAGI